MSGNSVDDQKPLSVVFDLRLQGFAYACLYEYCKVYRINQTSEGHIGQGLIIVKSIDQ